MRIADISRQSGDKRIVFEVRYTYQHQSRNQYDQVSYETRETVWHVIAPTEDFAVAAWRHRFVYPTSSNVFLDCKALLAVDYELSMGSSR